MQRTKTGQSRFFGVDRTGNGLSGTLRLFHIEGKRNSSLYLPYVAEEIAALKGAAAEDVVLQTEENARKLYGL